MPCVNKPPPNSFTEKSRKLKEVEQTKQKTEFFDMNSGLMRDCPSQQVPLPGIELLTFWSIWGSCKRGDHKKIIARIPIKTISAKRMKMQTRYFAGTRQTTTLSSKR
ncbi:hypothetical protein Lal_00002153 [Lupinus albus]|nr:hypothetical protein Lal_00002153 [Lupinus albus]